MSDSAPFVLVSAETVCRLCAGDSGSAVEIALRDLARDVEKITGRRLETAAAPERDAVIVRIDPAAFGIDARNAASIRHALVQADGETLKRLNDLIQQKERSKSWKNSKTCRTNGPT